MLISGARTTNQNKNFKPLFIGFGKQALEYARVLKSLNIKINSVCISNLKRNKNNLRKYEIVHIYQDIRRAISEKKYNCVFIFLPWYLIEKKIIYILKNTNKRIFCEKPIALSLKSLSKINKLSNRYNKKLYILYNRRYYNIHFFLKKKINKNSSIKAFIPEKINLTLKKIDKKLKGKIKYHLTSHWIDFFTSVTNKKIIKVKKNKNLYIFSLSGKKNLITVAPNFPGKITAEFKSNNYIYRLNSLENLQVIDLKKNKIIKKIDEFGYNKFKPGVLNLIKSVISNKKILLPETKDLINLYKALSTLPF